MNINSEYECKDFIFSMLLYVFVKHQKILNNELCFYTKLCTFAETLMFNLNFIVMAYKISDECIACGTCIDECPVDAISEGDVYVIDAELCTDCGSCAEVCPVEAITIDE